ncbi:MAG: hypothetical protein C5B50_01580 [Verrucomicrobia bacterium]|nr:MAG: hypothetical protein C5B50_01580 [Verrucomicrobiota bacterium]
MKHTLWQFDVCTTPGSEEKLAEVLETIFGEPAVSYTDYESQKSTVSVYFKEKPDWSHAQRLRLHETLKCGVTARNVPRFKLRRLPAQNWAESWKKHFKPREIGSKLLIKPSWSRRRPRNGQAVIALDPGLSFGTGQHPTTLFCLKELAARRDPNQPQSFLDIGTGSGILAIAAAKLGYALVHALDTDAEAIKVARTNARKNRVLQKIEFSEQDLARLSGRSARTFSIVCANLISNLLLAERGRIAAQVQPGGILVLAGILACEFATVQAAYEAVGMKLQTSRTQKEWRSGSFIRVIGG